MTLAYTLLKLQKKNYIYGLKVFFKSYTIVSLYFYNIQANRMYFLNNAVIVIHHGQNVVEIGS